MDTYTFMRQLADSWILLAMFGFFASAAIWAFLPSQRRAREDASMIPFRNDSAPKASPDACADQDAPNPKGQPHD
ncbi:cbb3-type cytochrome c oxidase subunit 3 [Loktanella salsilacus]|uniref:cbb3-type cytochrome c oxidase subunit 3 n=1 Tax=Loktanella salsilacus TaxID=195913 RepID=UPI0020B777A0|nr:cbb3-type cytochrome c oxidase subunit 3 [Loktanella salsilacus]UTH43708.1 cbb3-type cytochrome c oxidase subunit 3 [Loktanella salsilacus]|tara:strand:- start:16 stop:240 length:225 start_codon:yes stop_codon:yes gene_type:complete